MDDYDDRPVPERYEFFELFDYDDHGPIKGCRVCGAGVVNPDTHLDWHNKMEGRT